MCRKIKKKKHKKSRKEEEGKEEATLSSCAKELTKVVINLRGISSEYTESQDLYQVVRIGSPLTRKRSLFPPPLGPGGGETRSLAVAGEGVGGPNSDDGTGRHSGTLQDVYYDSSMIPR